jgi:hypothetical protein
MNAGKGGDGTIKIEASSSGLDIRSANEFLEDS